MEFDIQPPRHGLKVKAKVNPVQAKKLMESFAKCANGTCSCKTTEYEKLDGMTVSQTESGLTLDLNAKDGEVFDASCVSHCLDRTAAQIKKTTVNKKDQAYCGSKITCSHPPPPDHALVH